MCEKIPKKKIHSLKKIFPAAVRNSSMKQKNVRDTFLHYIEACIFTLFSDFSKIYGHIWWKNGQKNFHFLRILKDFEKIPKKKIHWLKKIFPAAVRNSSMKQKNVRDTFLHYIEACIFTLFSDFSKIYGHIWWKNGQKNFHSLKKMPTVDVRNWPMKSKNLRGANLHDIRPCLLMVISHF